jgi:ribosomal protein L14E/L6E/L27E
MERIEQGMFARSLAGHDKGSLYLVKEIKDEYVYLVDGEIRPLARPKKKKIKHIQIIRRIPEEWNPEKISDDDVKKLLKVEERNVKSRCY